MIDRTMSDLQEAHVELQKLSRLALEDFNMAGLILEGFETRIKYDLAVVEDYLSQLYVSRR